VELRHIRSFLSLAKTLNFSRAAKLVHCSQPALSLQIQPPSQRRDIKPAPAAIEAATLTVLPALMTLPSKGKPIAAKLGKPTVND
jgi:hypothetical protein